MQYAGYVALPRTPHRLFACHIASAACGHERPYAEIAAATGWTPSKVKINVYRARQRLVAELTATPASPAARPRRARAGAD